jgi:hypothetical protein
MRNTDDRTYNGWTNYETWLVALWIGDEPTSDDEWQKVAKKYLAKAMLPRDLSRGDRPTNGEQVIASRNTAQALQDHFRDSEVRPELKGIWAAMLDATMNEVNWSEIATRMVEEY